MWISKEEYRKAVILSSKCCALELRYNAVADKIKSLQSRLDSVESKRAKLLQARLKECYKQALDMNDPAVASNIALIMNEQL